jgi:hypothetical protein
MNVLQIKAAVRERDGFRCVKCGMTNAEHIAKYDHQLDVHRVTPGGAYSVEPGVCQTLCRVCHGPQPRRRHRTAVNEAGQVKFVALIPEELRHALRLEAIYRDGSANDVLVDILTDGLADALATIRRWRQEQQTPADAPFED